jgi:phage tail protein X
MPGPATYVTGQGEMVDLICANFYGLDVDAAEAVYAANPGLADLGPLLPQNTTLTLPAIAAAAAPRIATIQLFE